MTTFHVVVNKQIVDSFTIPNETINHVYEEYADYEIVNYAGTYYIVK